MTNRPTLFIVLNAAFLSMFITIVSPFNIYVGNPLEFSSSPIEFLTESMSYFFIFFAALSLPALIPNKKFKNIYSCFLCTILVVSVINTFFLFGYYGEFDGRGMEIDIFSLIAAVQILVAGVIIYLTATSNIRNYVFYGVACLVLSSFGIDIFSGNFSKASVEVSAGGAKGKKRAAHVDDVNTSFANLSKDKPNYLYIILDQVHGESAEDIFDSNKEFAKQFEGFTNFTNTSGVFPTTLMSITAIITDKIYDHSLDNNDYIKKAFSESYLLDLLQEKNFDLSFLTKIHYRDPLGDRNIPTLCIGDSRSVELNVGSRATGDYIDSLNMSIFKAVPEFLKSSVYRDENWIFSHSRSKWVADFTFFTEKMRAENDSPTFRVFHTLLTHTPINHDKSCKLLPQTLPGTYENYLAQDICGFSQVAKIIHRLKELRIYDNTFIIISSDHGRWTTRPEQEAKFGKMNAKYGNSHAMLMVKPFNARHEFKHDSSPASLLDIPSVILASVTNAAPKPHPKRRKYHNYIFKNGQLGKSKLPEYDSIYLIGNDIKNPSDWSQTDFESGTPDDMLSVPGTLLGDPVVLQP